MSKLQELFLDKEVLLFPSDTYWKYAIVRDISDHGIVFEITDAHRSAGHYAGQIVFYGFGSPLTFKLSKSPKNS